MNLEELLKIESICDLGEEEQLEIVGSIFDFSFDNNSEAGILHGFKLQEGVSWERLSPHGLTNFFYYSANGWSSLRKIRYQNTSQDWNFQKEELTNEIICLRKALLSEGFSNIQIERQCQIYTNLANVFSYIGRFVEAQDYWNRALNIISYFPMALGNKANGLFHYAQALFDKRHRSIFIHFTYHLLEDALKYKDYLDPFAKGGFEALHTYVKNLIPKEQQKNIPQLRNFNLGKKKKLEVYRRWCLDNCLYINPLNDLSNFEIACHDCLNLPTLIFANGEPPTYLNLFNQIKQEFGTARFFHFNSTTNPKPHYSDVDIVLVETNETIRYSYNIEQIKTSFRLAYSVLDKISYVLNDYLKLGIDTNKVSFRTVWYEKSNQNLLKEFFKNSNNWALRGLFWLSKDIYDKNFEFESALDPHAKEIANIRNSIEHRGFKVVSGYRLFPNMFDQQKDISYIISRSDFEVKALNLLKLTRAAIIYLSLAISFEEGKKDHTNKVTFPIIPSIVPPKFKF